MCHLPELCFGNIRETDLRRHGAKPLKPRYGGYYLISGVISPLVWAITVFSLLITLLTYNYQPPSIALRTLYANSTMGVRRTILLQSHIHRYIATDIHNYVHTYS